MIKRMNKILSAIAFFLLVSGCGEKFPDLGDGYRIEYGPGGPYKWILNPDNSVIINEHVLDFTFDSVYIIAVQRPFDSVPECVEGGKRYSDCKRAILKTSTFKQYWIINKKNESIFITEAKRHTNVYGPYKKEQYLMKRKILNIPDNLSVELD